jgi:hypothetical protein
MIARVGLSLCGLLLLALLLAGAWASWQETSPRDAWTLDDPVQIITNFAPQEKLDVSFRLCNTAHKPLRILGASIC